MPRDSSALDPTILLAHGDFVTALARGLVADPHRADDVAQDTFLAALSNPPRDASRLRAWLAAVTRNFARQSTRRDGRAHGREKVAARDEVTLSTAELCEREATRRAVVEALIDLTEPQRVVLLLRFYDGLPPRDIARRLALPVETVRTRIKRGLAELRRRLEERYAGEGRDWCEALAPLTLRVEHSGAPSLRLHAAIAGAACVVIALAIGIGFGTHGSKPASLALDPPSAAAAGSVASDPVATAAPADPARLPAGPLSHPAQNEKREALTATSGGDTQAAPPARVVHAPLTPPVRSITGRVLDAHDAPIPGALVFLGNQIRARGDEPFKPFKATTFDDCEQNAGSGCTHADAAGQFTLEGSDGYVTAWHADHGARTVPWSAASSIVLPSRVSITGKLVHASGAPIAGREITLDRERTTTTSDDGSFEFTGVEIGLRGLLVSLEGEHGEPATAASGLTPRKKGSWFGVRVDGVSHEPLMLVLHDAAQSFALVSGGAPFQGNLDLVPIGLGRVFRVPAGSARTSTGSFELEGLGRGPHLFLTRTGSVARADIPASASATPIELDLGTSDLTIRAPERTRVYVVPHGSGESAELMAGRQSAQTIRASGEVRIAPLPAGSYDIGIDRRGIVAQVDVRGTGTTIVLE
jgi:RNA polymerase sigma-70 factor (ECF subfamily)